jgi:hypothetical protein
MLSGRHLGDPLPLTRRATRVDLSRFAGEVMRFARRKVAALGCGDCRRREAATPSRVPGQGRQRPCFGGRQRS